MQLDITFLTIAQNSDGVLEACLKSCAGLGKHLVIDGGSTDKTIEIAERFGAEVVSNPFRYAAAQYNFGFSQVKTKWCFVIDSDERLTPGLREEISSLPSVLSTAGYEVPRQNMFVGDLIKHSGWWPDYNVRLIDVQRCHYDDRPVHARIIADGPVLRLDKPLLHHTYLSVEQYVEKLNKFTTREVKSRSEPQTASDTRSTLRKYWLKTPGRPLSRFVYMYFLRSGYKDGRVGFRLATLSAFYEYVAGLKVTYAAKVVDLRSESESEDSQLVSR